jgi:hypothetical protein
MSGDADACKTTITFAVHILTREPGQHFIVVAYLGTLLVAILKLSKLI